MNGRENVARLMEWGKYENYPKCFADRPHVNNDNVSVYTKNTPGIVVPTNRISHTNLTFLVSVYCAQKGQNDYSETADTMAVGGTVSDYICERKVGQDFEVAIYNEAKHEILCFTVNGDTRKIKAAEEAVSYLTLLGCLWEALYQDEEFYTQWLEFCNAMDNSDMNDAWNAACILNDNIYRRINGEMIEIDTYNSSVNELQLERSCAAGAYSPTSVAFGEFVFLAITEQNTTVHSTDNADFVGKYLIDPQRKYTAEEQRMMADNKLEDWYIVDGDDIEVCNDIIHTTGTSRPFRNFIFVGPPGSGKSHKAKAIANGIGLPYLIFTCNPSTEIFDIIGQVMPPSRDDLQREAWDFAAQLEELGGINFANIAKLHGLPSCDDISQAPEEVFFQMTGSRKTKQGKEPTVEDALQVWTEYMTVQFNDAIRQLKVAMKDGAGFTFTETDFIRAIENGWLIEIQEPNVILNEGVLVGLNSILNEGVITLQTGRTVYRHKDSVVIFTTNNNLYGLRPMNQSFLDRSAEMFFINRPPLPVVADRIMSISGCKDRKLVMEMAKLGEAIENAMSKEGIEDGVCGMRSLINWAIKSSYTNPYDAAIKTVINKTSMDVKCRNKLMKKLDESYFYQFRGR